MNKKFLDIVVAKEYEGKDPKGFFEKKTAWNRVGRAWASKTGDSISFELYMFPNQRYVITFKDKEIETVELKEASNE